LQARAVSISGTANPSYLARRQEHSSATVETEVAYTPTRPGDRAGLAVFADEQHHFFIGIAHTAAGPALVVTMRNGANDPAGGRVLASTQLTGPKGTPVRLRITARGAAYDFSFAAGAAKWKTMVANADGKILASERSNQFTGAVIGVLAERAD
jgi:xylan 1,4-beta-xylosidase